MILNAFNTLIASNTLSLESAKSKVRNYVSADFKDQILSKVPNPENVKQQLGTQITNIEELRQIETRFKSLKTRCTNLISQVDSKIEQIESIQDKINDIDKRFERIKEVTDVANQFIPILKGIITIAPVILGASTGLLANGLLITRIDKGLEVAKSKIVELEAVVKVLSSIQKYIDEQALPITNSCDDAIGILQRLKEQIEANCKQIDSVFLGLIATFPNTPIVDNDTKQPGEPTIPLIENPEEILDNLENSNKQLFIQYLQDTENNTGYRIVKL